MLLHFWRFILNSILLPYGRGVFQGGDWGSFWILYIYEEEFLGEI
jgi:hypothetical protein